MADVNELVVRLRPEGQQETQRALDETNKSFEDTVGDVEDSTGELDSFSKKWKGAGLAFAGTFGALTAAIASKMPIISEITAGLDAVLTSLALKIDNDVRPSLNDLTTDLFNLSQEIDDAEGAADGLGIALAGALEIAADRLGEQRLTQDLIVDFVVEVGEVTLQELDTEQIARDISFGDLLQTAITFSPVGIANLGFRIGQEFATNVMDGIATTIKRKGRIALLTLKQWKNTFIASLKVGFELIKLGFQTTWDAILNFSKKFLNSLASRFETRINQIINALNRLPGTNIDPVSIGRFETQSTQEIIQRNRARAQERISEIQGERSSRNQELQTMINTLRNAQTTQSLNVNGRELARVENEQRGEIVANRGR